MRVRDHSDDPGVDRRLYRSGSSENLMAGEFVYWNDLTHNRDKWRGIVNEVMKNLFP